MPELPEVEVVKKGLSKLLKSGDLVSKIEFHRDNLRNRLPKQKLKMVKKQSILAVRRRAKYLLIETSDYILLSHLGMTGQWREYKHPKLHDHISIYMQSGLTLVYNDPRRFGVFDIVDKAVLSKDPRLTILGPEPLENDFNADYLYKVTRQRKIPIKSLIMDQKVVVGVGNIYASEALYFAGIRPTARSSKLTLRQCEDLTVSIQNVLKQAIRQGGSSIRDYVDTNGESGSFQENHAVYGRQGEPCLKCRGAIRAKVLSGRNTFWCVNCQK
jgi:formamidopyrimidine-DNA glycosylase